MTMGILYIIATPIGNLRDITLRAIEVLKAVDVIVAEDTRHSQLLLQHYAISTPMLTLHEHNERECTAAFLSRLQKGESIALISDAGTPLISDPGYYLVHEARALDITVSPVPGPCAVTAALSASGMATDKFIFEGFLPAKAQARYEYLSRLQNEHRTLVFYEAPHRIVDSLEAMRDVFGHDRQAVLARELTKHYETFLSTNLDALVQKVRHDTNQQRGEIVVIVAGNKVKAIVEDAHIEQTISALLAVLPLKKAVEVAVKITGLRKNILYNLALQLKQST